VAAIFRLEKKGMVVARRFQKEAPKGCPPDKKGPSCSTTQLIEKPASLGPIVNKRGREMKEGERPSGPGTLEKIKKKKAGFGGPQKGKPGGAGGRRAPK